MKKIIYSTQLQVKLWTLLANILPLTCLSGLFFLQVFGLGSYVKLALSIGATTMFVIAVIWWWWALRKILQFYEILNTTEKNLQDIKIIIKELKRDIN